LYAGTHDEIEKLFRDSKGCISTGPYHRFPELDWRIPSGRGFINDAHLPAVDRIHSVDDAYVGLPRVNQIHDIITMAGVEKVGTANKDPLPLVPFGSRRYGVHFQVPFPNWGVESLEESHPSRLPS
jgi:hypothetical protein